MAEYEERTQDDLTEEPSSHRLEELRAEGIVTQSKELTSTLVLFSVLLCLYFICGSFFSSTLGFMKDVFTKDLLRPLEVYDWRSFIEITGRSSKLILVALTPVALVVLVVGVMGSIVQTGFIYNTTAIEPDFDRINPVSGLFRLLSWQNLLNGTKATLKLFAIVGAVYFSVRSQIVSIPSTIALSNVQILPYIGSIVSRVFIIVTVILLFLAAIDYWMQWLQFRKRAMMTKQEAKRELKEREGDPQIKARIRSIQRDVARKRMMKAVPKADVVVTNPTHFAIAIEYKPQEMVAPKVVAKGADFLAEKIKEIAREAGIPMVENKILARTLYKNVKVGQMIPRSLYQAVAEILAYVYKLKGKKFTARQPDINP